jgi:hypothetical protein
MMVISWRIFIFLNNFIIDGKGKRTVGELGNDK